MVVEPTVVDSELTFVITVVSGVGNPVVADGCASVIIVVVEASVVVAIVLEASVEVGVSRSVVAIDIEVTGSCVVRPAIVDDALVVVDG